MCINVLQIPKQDIIDRAWVIYFAPTLVGGQLHGRPHDELAHQ